MSDPEKDIKAGLFDIVFNPLAAVIAFLYSGFIIQSAWSWFIVQFGLPKISIPHAIGLVLCVALFKSTSISKEEMDKGFLSRLVENLLIRTFLFVALYIVHLFV